MDTLWQWISDPINQKNLSFIGSGVVAFITAIWTIYKFSHKSKKRVNSPESSANISIKTMNGGNVAGRDQYLTHIEGISEERFQTLCEERAITNVAITRFFKILKDKNVPPEDLDSKLRQIATRYNDVAKRNRGIHPPINTYGKGLLRGPFLFGSHWAP